MNTKTTITKAANTLDDLLRESDLRLRTHAKEEAQQRKTQRDTFERATAAFWKRSRLSVAQILRETRAALPKGETIKVYNDKRRTARRIKIMPAYGSLVALIHAGGVLVRLGVPFFQIGDSIGFTAPL